jgi:uncharacterized membrane protein YeaQ/YmgE (transglycosylase-associated protein family)
MGIISWIVVGLIAGFIGSKIVNKTGEGLIRDIILGIIGAFVGGWIFTAIGAAGVTGVNIYSIFARRLPESKRKEPCAAAIDRPDTLTTSWSRIIERSNDG